MKKEPDLRTDPKTRANLFDTTVLPVLCYAGETWSPTKAHLERIRITHVALEGRIVGITLTEQRSRDFHRKDMRKFSQVKDPVKHVIRRKLEWAGHVARRTDDGE